MSFMSTVKPLDTLSSSVLCDLEKVLTLVSDGASSSVPSKRPSMSGLSLPLSHRPRKQAPPPTGEKRTTVMMKNLPNRYSRAMVVALLESRLPVDAFDFVYVPIDFATRQNFAYAFINLSSPSMVKSFFAIFTGFRFPLDPTVSAGSPQAASKGKTCEIVFARVQGIEANVNRLINSPILTACCRADPDDNALPLVFTSGAEPVRFADLLTAAVPRENALLAWTPAPFLSRTSPSASPVLTPSALLGQEESWITDTLIKEMMTLLDTSSSASSRDDTPSSIYYDLSNQLPH